MLLMQNLVPPVDNQLGSQLEQSHKKNLKKSENTL